MVVGRGLGGGRVGVAGHATHTGSVRHKMVTAQLECIQLLQANKAVWVGEYMKAACVLGVHATPCHDIKACVDGKAK